MKQMQDHFKYRTGFHLWCVHKWHNKIASLNDHRIDRELLDKERDDHDEGKWLEPEYTPYLYISWSYKCKRDGVTFDIPNEIKDSMHEATFHHIKSHRHHPEFWDENVTIEGLNKDDRDRPSEGKLVDGAKMPLTYVAAMVADWMAMSEELGGHPQKWADANINVRWKFSFEQIELIYYLIDRLWINPSSPDTKT